MKKHRAIFVCNALEDFTRNEREIVSDSPAASKKIFLMAKALKKSGTQIIILSMGRGKQNFRGRYFKSKTLRYKGVSIIYAPFFQLPILSQLVSFISLPYLLYRLNYFKGLSTSIFYNRSSAYISSLIMSSFLGYRRVLDLEDGEFFTDQNFSFHILYNRCKKFLYTKLCNGGTILACSALSRGKEEHELCYFGAIEQCVSKVSWQPKNSIKFLLGGTVSDDTGARNLIEAIKILKLKDEPWINRLEFIITGKGDCIDDLKKLSVCENLPIVKVCGRLSDKEYSLMLDECNVGMALKPNNGKLADTTFPSKVIELASSGLLVLTTDISDVRKVLEDGALYLEDDSVSTLIESLKYISENTFSAINIAEKGLMYVKTKCSIDKAGMHLSGFIVR